MKGPLYIGCAGWSIPSAAADSFPQGGSHLERYGCRFSCVEINSSFYRPHRPQTYVKWKQSVPENFRFSVKAPKSITHTARLKDTASLLQNFLNEAGELGEKLGCLLFQLPPSFAFDEKTARDFFDMLREKFSGGIAFEPRHVSWFAPEVHDLLTEFHIARVAADPAIAPEAAEPGGWSGLVYYRLHGSPEIYRSAYSAEYLNALLPKLALAVRESAPAWCIFDNTASGAATFNALDLVRLAESIR